MRFKRSWLRYGLLAFLLATFLGPIGAGAQSVDCDDFANPEAAQYLLDSDDSYADDLDPDGDGIACNEDEEDEAGETGSDDYLATITTEVETIEASFVEFFDVMLSFHEDMSDAEVIEISDTLDDISDMWAEYPDTAPVLDAPSDYAEIDETYQEWVELVGEAGEGWHTYQDVVSDSTDAELERALVAFDEAQLAARDLGDTLLDMVEETGFTPEPDDTADRDDALSPDEYLQAVDDHFNALVDSFQEFDEITSSEVNDDDRDALYAIYDTWASAAEVAATIEPPAGYEDLHEAYLEVANGFTELYDIYASWIESESGSEEEDEAFAAFEDQIDVLNDLCVEFDQMLTDAS